MTRRNRRSPLRVLVLTPDFPPARGGINVLAERVVSGFRRVDACVVTLGGPSVSEEGVLRVRERAGGSRRRRAVAWLNVVALLEGLRRRPDVILSLHVNLAPAAVLMKVLRGVPYVQYVHAREVPARPRIARLALRRAAAVVAVSRFAAQLAREAGADPALVRLVAPGTDLPVAPPTRDRERLVVSIARLDDASKGHDVLLRAMRLVTERVPDARLVVVGDGVLRADHERLASSLGLNGSAEFVGAVDDDAKWNLLSRASVFALPSRLDGRGGAEGFGIAFLEASAWGVPVVAGAVGGAVDAVLDQETGLLVDPTDPKAVASAIARLLLDPAEARALGAAGARRAEAYGWNAVSSRVEDLLLEVAAA